MSLQTRLALWLALGLGVLFLLHGLVTERAPRKMTESYISTRLEHDAEWLLEGLSEHGHLTPGHVPAIFLRPNSGHFFLLRTASQTLVSPSSAGQTLPVPEVEGISHGRMADGEPLLLLRRDLPHGGVLVVAESLRDLNDHLATFRSRFVLLSLGLLALLLLAQFLLLRWVLRPLRAVVQDSERLQQGKLEHLPLPAMAELQPMVTSFNGVLDSQARRLARSRHALADLAHALKTPLAVLRQTLGAASPPQALEAVNRMEGIVQRELRRARWQADGAQSLRPLNVRHELEQLLQAMRLIYRARGVQFDLQGSAGAPLRMDREDFHELWGNLLDNAAKWAQARVVLHLSESATELAICVDDDGLGADLAVLNAPWQRGQRLDESTPGTGLGLAIVREIVAAYGGELAFSRSEQLGGLRVCVRLPRAY